MGSGASKDNKPTPQQNGSTGGGGGGGGGRPGTTAGKQGGDGGGGGGEQKPQQNKSPMAKQVERYKYPKAAPPNTRKKEIFDAANFKQVDSYPATMPKEVMYGSFKEVAKWLTEKFNTQLEKLRSLFIWAASIDVGSLQQSLEELPEEGTPLDYLLRIHWQMGNHAHFFAQLCRAANLPCIIVTGMNKSAAYQLGGPVSKKTMAAQWNAVYVDDSWRLIDIFWASTCVVGKKTSEWSILDVDGEIQEDEDEGEDDGETKHQINESYTSSRTQTAISPPTHYPDDPDWHLLINNSFDFDFVFSPDKVKEDNHEDEGEDDDGQTKHQINESYFIPDPDCIITTHYPDDPDWQLMEDAFDVDEFEKRVYIRERFFDMGLGICKQSEPYVLVSPKKGELDIIFSLDQTKDPRPLQYRYLMFRQRKPGEKAPSMSLERFILFQKKKDIISYWCQFPFTGRYKMDIFGQEDRVHETFDLCCSYLFDVTVAKKDAKPLPDIPDIGWGPGADAEAHGLEPLTHFDPVIESNDGNMQVKFKMNKPLDVLQNLKSEEMEEWLLKRNAVMYTKGDELVIDMRLPQKGEYALNLFGAEKGHKGEMPNLVNYLMRVKKDNPNLKPFPKLHEGILGHSGKASSLGIQSTSHPQGLLDTDSGQFSVDFAHSGDYEIFVECDNHDLDRKALANCVNVEKGGKGSKIDVRFPQAGEYSLNVYAKKKGSDQIVHVHSYLATSTQSDKSQTPLSKGDVPVAPYATSSEAATLQIPKRENNVVCELQKRNHNEAPTHDKVKVQKTADEDVMTAKLADENEYRMDVFEQKPNGALQSLCIYQLVRHEPMPEHARNKAAAAEDDKPATPDDQLSAEEKERRREAAVKEANDRAFRESLKVAMASQDTALLRKAISDFEKNKVKDPKRMLEKAKKMLRFLTISEEMKDAMAKRDLQRLEKAVTAAETEGFDKKLGLQFQMAKKVLEQLRRIEKLRHAILDLDQKTIAELKSYTKPPDGVYEVMSAVFVLLGNAEKELKEWPQVVIWIGKTGKESLKRRITEFNVGNLNINTAQKSKKRIQKFELDFIRDVSAGAATFYVWSMGMIEECESQFVQNGGDLNMLRPGTAKSKKGK